MPLHLTGSSMTRTATEAKGRVSIVRSGGRLCFDGLAYATSASTRIYSPVSRCLRRPILCFCSVLVVLVCHVMLSRFNKLSHSKALFMPHITGVIVINLVVHLFKHSHVREDQW